MSNVTEESFWNSVGILINKPHIVNKRLWGRSLLMKYNCSPSDSNWKLPDTIPRLETVVDGLKKVNSILEMLNVYSCENAANECSLEIIILELLPKAYNENHAYNLVCLDKSSTRASFFDITPLSLKQTLCADFPYHFNLSDDTISLETHCDKLSQSIKWLNVTVLPQFIKWASESPQKDTSNIQSSLSLVSNEKYYVKYNELKIKYGKEMVKIWPECTDPSKFVYEDVAIATYLILLWEKPADTGPKSTFVDLGCGNGLLVYILTMEGYTGVGIDVRKRNIWDMYPSEVKLQVKTITPSDLNLFQHTEWIIGNHSDELTPWIPVVSARSSYNCKFFLLPCCAYNFDGTKYQRQDSSKSQYMEYLDYIQNLCTKCGFTTEMDRLKIPSTKRICIIGRERKYPADQHSNVCNEIQNIIGQTGTNLSDEVWIDNFKPRETTERVKNCTRVDKNIIHAIVEIITKYLLEGCEFEEHWSLGKTIDLSNLVPLIPQEMLNSLKMECGGLQTLLKNNHHIFKVLRGKVQMRYPKSTEELRSDSKAKNIKIQVKPCWFYSNHPKGCPLTDRKCSFLHTDKKNKPL